MGQGMAEQGRILSPIEGGAVAPHTSWTFPSDHAETPDEENCDQTKPTIALVFGFPSNESRGRVIC